MFASKARAHLCEATALKLKGRLLSLPANITQGWKSLPRARCFIHNTLFPSLIMIWLNKIKLHYSRLEMLVRDKHSSLLDPVVSYAKNEVL
jgi:hypothetical protein